MTEHVNSSPAKDPIMIFPEGTCINNTSVMRFSKGCFEIDTNIYPVAIKYNAFFGDAFWDSSKYSMGHYIFKIITAWCIVCDIFYLPATKKRPLEGLEMNESQSGQGDTKTLENALQLAQRCQTDIAKRISVDNLQNWDGGLKRKLLSGKAKEVEVVQKQERISKKFSVKLKTTFESESEDFSEASKSSEDEEEEEESLRLDSSGPTDEGYEERLATGYDTQELLEA